MPINRGMDKEQMVHIFNGTLLGHKKRSKTFAEMWINLEPVIQGKVSKKEKQILYINTDKWNPERWY